MAPRSFSKKCLLKLVEPFSGHCLAKTLFKIIELDGRGAGGKWNKIFIEIFRSHLSYGFLGFNCFDLTDLNPVHSILI